MSENDKPTSPPQQKGPEPSPTQQPQFPPWWPFPYVPLPAQQPQQEPGAKKYDKGNGGFEVGYGSAVLRLFGPNVACIVVNLALAGMILFFYHEVTAWHARLDAQVAAILGQVKDMGQEIEKNRAIIIHVEENAKQQRDLLQEWVYKLLQRRGWMWRDDESTGK